MNRGTGKQTIPDINIVCDTETTSKEETCTASPFGRRRISRSPSPRRPSVNLEEDKDAPTFQIFKYNKATTFETGEGECGKCKKKIFAAEKVWGPGTDNPWHKDCLNCYSCSKRLETATMHEHEDDPYCLPCYNKQFAPLGKM
jgi:hypothetical protein